MAEPTPTLTSEGPGEPLVYRPISGLAIASLTLAAVYVALVVLSAVVALVKGEPFFLPLWLLALPVAGVVLSLLARRHIRNAEDTRAGMTLAQWGLWLSIVSGLGYLTYSIFTRLAVQEQANRFLLEKGPEAGFFPLLEAGSKTDQYTAFLLTQPVSRRKGHRPHEHAKIEELFDQPLGPNNIRGPLSLFVHSPLVRVFQQAVKTPPTIEPMGLKSWDYESRGYKVSRNYRLTTAEGSFDLLLTAHSVDGEAEGRKWFVRLEAFSPAKPTALGKKMQDLRRLAFAFTFLWQVKLSEGKLHEAYFLTREPSERKNLQEVYDSGISGLKHARAATALFGICYAGNTLTAAGGGPVPIFGIPHGFPRTSEEVAELYLPEYEAFQRATSYVKSDQLRGEEKLVAEAQKAISRLFDAKNLMAAGIMLRQEGVDYSLWSVPKPGRMEIHLDFEMPLTLVQPRGPMACQVLGKAVVATSESADPLHPEILQQLRFVRLECERVVVIPFGAQGQ